MLTSAGKSTTIAPIVATPSLPCPKISSSTGAMATSGTERSSIAIGMNANSNGLITTNSAAIDARHDEPGHEADRRVAEGDQPRPEQLGARRVGGQRRRPDGAGRRLG